MHIQGKTVRLWTKTQTGTDAFNDPTYKWTYEDVDNVLIGEPTPEEQTNEMSLTGRSIAYTLGIPKGDTHDWENQIVEFFNEKFRTFGIPVQGIEVNLPRHMPWHKKVKCERYE